MHLLSLSFFFFPFNLKKVAVRPFTISHHCARESKESWRVCQRLYCSLYSLTISCSCNREQFSLQSPPPTVTPVGKDRVQERRVWSEKYRGVNVASVGGQSLVKM